ncbi:MAG TPA: ABC transporter permease [Ktedonobacteraceae bacterium]|nr:ABC transporter permease [Ktedonobacteraceae bacterium]
MSITLWALYNEIYRRMILLWSYRFNILMQILEVLLLYIGVSFFVGNGRFDPGQLAGTLLGYVIWFYARIMILNMGSELVGEAQAGTLEQTYMSPVPPVFLLIGRMLALMIATSIVLLLPMIGIVAFFHIQYTFHWESIPVLILTMAGLFGFSLAISGAALVFKQIGSLADLTQNIMLFLTGALLPVTLFPPWLAAVAQTLPITQGIIVLRSIVLSGKSFADVWGDGSLPALIINSVVYVAVGAAIFLWCEAIAKRSGSMGQY